MYVYDDFSIDIIGTPLLRFFDLRALTAADVWATTKSPFLISAAIIVVLPYPGGAIKAVAYFNNFLTVELEGT